MRPLSCFSLLMLTAATPLAQDADSAYRLFGADDVFALEWADRPDVSPDGRHVVYTRMGYSRMTDRATESLWRVDAESKTHQPLVTDRAASGVQFSPPRDRIAYRTGPRRPVPAD